MLTKLLISGSNGFVASHLLAKLAEGNSYDIKALPRSAGDVEKSETWLNAGKADVVIHLASRTFVPESWSNPSEFFRTNVIGTVQALEYCKANKARFIYISSYLYGTPASLPIDETFEVQTTNPYMLSKKSAEDVCKFYSANFSIPVTILRPFNIYGTGQPDKFLIPTIVNQILQSDEITVNDLEPKRDYVFITDVVNAIIQAIGTPFDFEIFNIASGVSHSVQDIITILEKIVGKKIAAHSRNDRRPNEVMDTAANIAKAVRLLNWQPRWSIERGLEAIVQTLK